jgi:hypothetical protein
MDEDDVGGTLGWTQGGDEVAVAERRAPRAAQLFRVVDRLFDLFPRESGFRPYTFVAFAQGPWDGRNVLRRSFRYETDACWTHLTVSARPRSPWRQRVVQSLVQAGYESWLTFEDSSDLRRRLRTSAERRRELAFLKDLGLAGSPATWPRRTVQGLPAQRTHVRHSRGQWKRVIDEARACDAGWDDLCIGFSRSGKRTARATTGAIAWTVGVINYWHSKRGLTFDVYVGASGSPASPGRAPPLPPGAARILRRILMAADFEPNRTAGRRYFGFNRTFTDARQAARACVAIYDAVAAATL